MRNLKRLLTMVMAIAMLMSLMVVGAGATSFNDDKDITHKDAVEKMVSLNIINGRDGNFDPNGIVTRAEMAKMICIAQSGGNDPKYSASPVAAFTDTKGHWAEGYIEYCVNMGIAAGLGDKTFGPDQKVTATQAAKMLLVALGYDAQYEKYVGASWALYTNRTAQQKGLYDEIQSIDPNAPMSRDAAAQMVDNFTSAYMVKYEFGITGNTGGSVTGVKQANDTSDTVLTKYYKLVEKAGVLTSVSYDSKKKEYIYTVGGVSFQSATNYSEYFGANVEVLWRNKDNSVDASKNPTYSPTNDSVYDINLKDSAILATGTMDDFGKYDTTKNTLKFNGVVYDVDLSTTINGSATPAAIETVCGYNGTTGTNVTVTSATDDTAKIAGVGTTAYKVSLIDLDNDGKLDKVAYIPFTVEKVSYAGATNTTFIKQGAAQAGTAAGSVENKDAVLYDGIAKDDIVAHYKSANVAEDKDTFVKLETKTGTISGVKANATEYQIDGTWYTNMSDTTMRASDKIDYVAVGTTIFYAKITDAAVTTKNLLAVYNVTVDAGPFSDNLIKAKVMFMDGTKKVITLDKFINGATNATTELNNTNYAALVSAGVMYSYRVNSDGEYEIMTLVDNKNEAGHDGVGGTSAYINKNVGGYELADDAKVIIVVAGDDAKQYTGKELKNNLSAGSFGISSTVLYNKVSGYNYAKTVTIKAAALPEINTGSNYGYLLDDAWQTTNDSGDTYRKFRMWTAKGELIAVEKETASVNGLTEGTVVTYDNDGDGKIKNVEKANVITSAVTAWDGDKKITIEGLGNSEVDKDDTTVLYVNTEKYEGYQNGSITEREPGYNNVYYIGNSNVLDLLIVDTTNRIASQNAAYVSMDKVATQQDLNNAFAANSKIVLNGAFNPNYNVTIPANKTLILAGDSTIAQNVTLSANAELVIDGKVTLNGTNDFTATGAKVSGKGTLTLDAKNNLAGFDADTILNQLTVKNIVLTEAAVFAPDNDLTIPANQSLTVDSFTVAANKALNVNGNLVVKGTLDVTTGTTTMVVNGTATLNAADTKLKLNSEDITGTGTLTITTPDAATATANLKVANLIVDGAFAPSAAWTIPAGQTVIVKGNLTPAATMKVDVLGDLTVEGTYTTAAAGTVAGTLTIKKAATIAATHDITGAGVVKVAQGATLAADANIANVENAGIVTTTGAITLAKVTNTGIVNLATAGVITELVKNTGTINANGNIDTVKSNEGTINVLDNLTIGTLTANTSIIKIATGKTLTITNAASAALYESITAEAAAQLIVKESTTVCTAGKWYSDAGAVNKVGTQVNGVIPAATYTWKAVYTNDTGATINAWCK